MAARYIVFPLACRKLDWAAAGAMFQEEGARILTLWDSIPAERLGERVLVRRLRGLEDSSRYWSVAMTVEHLNIVGLGIRGIISGLRKGELPARPARTEDVKPSGGIHPAEVRTAFTRMLSVEASANAVEPSVPRGVGPRVPHPWFGPLDADRWHCLLGIHQRIHRHQIEAIRSGLRGR
jgi:hypothetical protein